VEQLFHIRPVLDFDPAVPGFGLNGMSPKNMLWTKCTGVCS